MKKAEKELYMKKRLEEMKSMENELRAEGFSFIGGVDEVGRGPLAGPVVAACVVLPEDFHVLGVDDSKKLTEKKRDNLYDVILENALAYGIGERDNHVIDEINILEATKLAMTDAVRNADAMLREKCGKETDYILFDAMQIDQVEKPQSSIIKGDSKSVSIAAASIIAKVYRDRMMIDYDKIYPGYGFVSNKGYGTKLHYEGLDQHGISEIHRRSFLNKYIAMKNEKERNQ